jgi:hypothetical protein
MSALSKRENGRARDPARKTGDLVVIGRGPLKTVYACPFCRYMESFPHARPGSGVGRGYGLRMGATLYAAVIRHIKSTHPERLAP